MSRIQVLVVEDSLTVRKRLLEVLAADPGLEVVGEASDGQQAIELCERLRPDVITMDMILPGKTGLDATEHIMAHCPTPILIVSSSTNRGELFKTYDALAAGAVDVLDKPHGDESDPAWERRLVSTVKLVSRIKVITHPRLRLRGAGLPSAGPRAEPAERPWPAVTSATACAAVGIGASTGGPGAILDVLRAMPANYAIPILLVLHISEPFGVAFADWLGSHIALDVCYPVEGEPLSAAAGRVTMAPPNRHLVVRRGRLYTTGDAERHSCRPSVDVLFESLARECGPHSAACLLTGMGRDGALGLLELRRAGAVTIAQDEATSVVYGMPREAARVGAADMVLPLHRIGPALAAFGLHHDRAGER